MLNRKTLCTTRIDTPCRRGFTLAELLVVIGILAIVLAIGMPVLGRIRESARSVQCINNLRQIVAALRQYAVDNGGRYPDPGRTGKSWEQHLSGVGAATLQCPSDFEIFSSLGSSYDWRDTGRDSTTMAGRLIEDLRRGDAVLAFEAFPGWHRAKTINVGRLDGSAGAIPSVEFMQDLSTPILSGE